MPSENHFVVHGAVPGPQNNLIDGVAHVPFTEVSAIFVVKGTEGPNAPKQGWVILKSGVKISTTIGLTGVEASFPEYFKWLRGLDQPKRQSM